MTRLLEIARLRPKGEHVEKAPYFFLPVEPDQKLRLGIAVGEINCTIREGKRPLQPGCLLALGCEKVPWLVLADIEAVRHCALREVSEREWLCAGYASRPQFFGNMNKYYPSISKTSLMTVVFWKNARGALVDGARIP